MVDLWEVVLLGSNFTCQYASRFGPKLKQPLGLKLAKLFWCLILYQHVMVYSHAEYIHHNISKIPPQFGLYLLFCIVSNCQFKVDLWEILLLGSNFTRQYANRFGKKSLQTLKVKSWQLHSLHLLACKIENENLLVCLTNYFYEKCWLPITASAK